ncbi:MAG: hypothetical protein K2M73_09500 [Lachnospiraceae bacterium]|nr:hypothetical protein [Lachnospiraceae bacterium]
MGECLHRRLSDAGSNFDVITKAIKYNWGLEVKDDKSDKQYTFFSHNMFEELFVENRKELGRIVELLEDKMSVNNLVKKLKRSTNYKELMSVIQNELSASNETMKSLMTPITKKLNAFFRLSSMGICMDNLFSDANDLDKLPLYTIVDNSNEINVFYDKQHIFRYGTNSIVAMLMNTNECKLDYKYEINEPSDTEFKSLIYVNNTLVIYNHGEESLITHMIGDTKGSTGTSNNANLSYIRYVMCNQGVISDIKSTLGKMSITGRDIIYVDNNEYIKTGRIYKGIVFITSGPKINGTTESVVMEMQYQ